MDVLGSTGAAGPKVLLTWRAIGSSRGSFEERPARPRRATPAAPAAAPGPRACCARTRRQVGSAPPRADPPWPKPSVRGSVWDPAERPPRGGGGCAVRCAARRRQCSLPGLAETASLEVDMIWGPLQAGLPGHGGRRGGLCPAPGDGGMTRGRARAAAVAFAIALGALRVALGASSSLDLYRRNATLDRDRARASKNVLVRRRPSVPDRLCPRVRVVSSRSQKKMLLVQLHTDASAIAS